MSYVPSMVPLWPIMYHTHFSKTPFFNREPTGAKIDVPYLGPKLGPKCPKMYHHLLTFSTKKQVQRHQNSAVSKNRPNFWSHMDHTMVPFWAILWSHYGTFYGTFGPKIRPLYGTFFNGGVTGVQGVWYLLRYKIGYFVNMLKKDHLGSTHLKYTL